LHGVLGLVDVAGDQAGEAHESRVVGADELVQRRDFERRFQLADYVVVTGAGLADGLLSITLERQLPEQLKPRRVEIKTGGGEQIADKAA